MIRSLTRLEARNRLRMLPALLAIAAAVAVLAACSSSGTSSTGSSSSSPIAATADSLKTADIGGVRVPGPGNNLNLSGGLWHDVPVSR